LALDFESTDLRNDEDVVREAVQQNGMALEFASRDLRGNQDIAKDAIVSS
jgi:hypothetical protein